MSTSLDDLKKQLEALKRAVAAVDEEIEDRWSEQPGQGSNPAAAISPMPLLLRVTEAAQYLRIGKTRMYELLQPKDGNPPEVASGLVGSIRMVPFESLRVYVEQLSRQEFQAPVRTNYKPAPGFVLLKSRHVEALAGTTDSSEELCIALVDATEESEFAQRDVLGRLWLAPELASGIGENEASKIVLSRATESCRA
jgi:hypothetical protein